jgi:hypothetical protein
MRRSKSFSNTFRESHQAINGIIGWEKTKHAVDNSCKSATEQGRDTFDNASVALLGVLLLETALDLSSGFRVVEKGVQPILVHPGEGEHSTRPCQSSQYSRGLHCDGCNLKKGRE